MAITSMEKVFQVEDEEYGYSAVDQYPTAGGNAISLVCPKITGCLTGKGVDTNNADGIFDNDPACKPTFAKKVNRAGAISVPMSKNGLWLGSLTSNGKVAAGTPFSIHFINGNIAKPFATSK